MCCCASCPATGLVSAVVMQVVVKSQILAGGRGLGTFKGGLKGGVHIVEASKALDLAKRMLGDTLVTKQTGPAGKPVGTLFIASKLQLTREMYFAILLDRKTAGRWHACLQHLTAQLLPPYTL